MCRNGCDHSPPSRLRDLLLAIAIFLAILPFAGAPIYRRLQRQIERTEDRWPVHPTAQPPSAETAPTSANTAPPHDTWLPPALGSFATLAFFSFWYWTLLKAQSLHPRTRGYPHYDGGHGGSAL